MADAQKFEPVPANWKFGTPTPEPIEKHAMSANARNVSLRVVLVDRCSDATPAAAGDRVTATATDLDVPAARERREMGGVEFESMDVRNAEDVIHQVTRLGDLDVVVNCAGVIRRSDEHRPEVFCDVIDINLNGTMRVCAAAREGLKARRGSIINIASMLSFFGGGLVPGYSASKGGIVQLTKSLAIAYAEEGIRVNAVAPGWIATPLTQALQDDPVRSAQIVSRTPLGRWGTPEVADPVLFLPVRRHDLLLESSFLWTAVI